MTIWVQDQKRQVEANVTVPAYLWQDLMTDYKDLQSAISAYGSVIPELLAFNDTMTSMDAYVTKSG